MSYLLIPISKQKMLYMKVVHKNKFYLLVSMSLSNKYFYLLNLVKFVKWQNMFENGKWHNLIFNYPKIMNKVSKGLEFHYLLKYVTHTCK